MCSPTQKNTGYLGQKMHRLHICIFCCRVAYCPERVLHNYCVYACWVPSTCFATNEFATNERKGDDVMNPLGNQHEGAYRSEDG